MSLATGKSDDKVKTEEGSQDIKTEQEQIQAPPTSSYSDNMFDKLRSQVASLLRSSTSPSSPSLGGERYAELDEDDEADLMDDMDINVELLRRDKAQCTREELDTIRRERNRMHAKRTRLRKKKLLNQMEEVCISALYDIYDLFSHSFHIRYCIFLGPHPRPPTQHVPVFSTYLHSVLTT